MSKLKSSTTIAIATFLLSFVAIDVSKAQWNVPDRNQNPNDIIFLGDTENFDSTVLIIPLFDPRNLPNYYPPATSTSYPPGTQLTQVLVCHAQVILPVNPVIPPTKSTPSPCSTIATLASLPKYVNCEMKSVTINISALKANTSQSNEKIIESSPINISSIFDSATQERLGIKSSQSQSWKSFWASPNVGNICKIPWPPIWALPPTPTPSPKPTSTPSPSPTSPSTPVPEPSANFGMGIGIFGLGWLYNKKKRALKSSKLRNHK